MYSPMSISEKRGLGESLGSYMQRQLVEEKKNKRGGRDNHCYCISQL